MAYIQNDYKFWIFGKTTRACVYRIADLRAYNYEERIENTGGDSKPQKKSFVRMAFINTEGLSVHLRRDEQHKGVRESPEVFRQALRSSEDPRKRLEYLEGTGRGNQETPLPA